jgi:HEAT repeat protein
MSSLLVELFRPTCYGILRLMRFRKAILAFALLAAIVAGLVFFGTKRQPQPSYQGRSARVWLDQIFAPPPLGKSPEVNRQAAFQAFRAMGTNAHPFLLAALEARETPLQRAFRLIYPRLPSKIQARLTPPPDPATLRSAADDVLLNVAPRLPVAELLTLADSGARREVFQLATLYIGPSDTSQTPLLILTCRDTNAILREDAAACLERIGPGASDALPVLSTLCADTNLAVRAAAASALYHINGQTNEAAPVLKGVLAQSKDERELYNAAINLVMMKDPDPVATTTLIGLLTNTPPSWLRGPACQWLGNIGHSATSAVPALRQLLQDPDPNLRQTARDALARIQSEAATNIAQ